MGRPADQGGDGVHYPATDHAHNKDFYLLDVTRGRYEYPQLRDTAVTLASRWKPHKIYIEDASVGIALTQELRQAGIYAVVPVPVARDKISRMYLQQAKFEAGQVLFPKGAAFLPALESELLAFPQSKTNDQVVSTNHLMPWSESAPKLDRMYLPRNISNRQCRPAAP
jgi:predicted phage terminase large subunit-like protein